MGSNQKLHSRNQESQRFTRSCSASEYKKIPEETHKKQKKRGDRRIVIASLLCVAVYVVFCARVYVNAFNRATLAPVRAAPRMSLPINASGMAAAWMGVISSKPMASMAFLVESATSREENSLERSAAGSSGATGAGLSWTAVVALSSTTMFSTGVVSFLEDLDLERERLRLRLVGVGDDMARKVVNRVGLSEKTIVAVGCLDSHRTAQ